MRIIIFFRNEECVELFLKYGARIDTEARMCFPGSHSNNCEESGKYISMIIFFYNLYAYMCILNFYNNIFEIFT